MNERRPVNRVTPKRKPAADSGSDATRRRASDPRGRPTPDTEAARRSADTGRRSAGTPPARGASEQAAGRPARVRPTRRRTTRGQEPASRPAAVRLDKSAAARTEPTPSRQRFGASWTTVAAAVVAAAVLAAFAAVAALRPGVNDSNAAFVDGAATEEVRAAADNALRTIYGYDIADIDGYQDKVRQVVTDKMAEDLDKFAGTTIEAIKQAQTSADAKPEPVGVTMLTEDRAELLVNLVVSATKDGVAQQSVAGPVVLRMRKVDGRWLAADIVDQ
ncbi:hypothetical protein IU468_00010 [Nocardia farcinica]|uniref:hypothetical protein n=1 Tax=Nocardia farcinica TaxID=37329 RepID=UPI001893FA26|nr:hypothetical protein [Nocardia farcinica]MBF6254692.1 hypothetical protein [Nocardia farcinica]MBF6295818.1 hypothetical protein [Nocardia farcinica]MBF6382382.1 hypothetical protein [Nocardia farcinica]MBF6445996.1 hypothetical protein [Nocardia farcinica]MBF6577370.1 hypothetical protein [Nocardia farcinica]